MQQAAGSRSWGVCKGQPAYSGTRSRNASPAASSQVGASYCSRSQVLRSVFHRNTPAQFARAVNGTPRQPANLLWQPGASLLEGLEDASHLSLLAALDNHLRGAIAQCPPYCTETCNTPLPCRLRLSFKSDGFTPSSRSPMLYSQRITWSYQGKEASGEPSILCFIHRYRKPIIPWINQGNIVGRLEGGNKIPWIQQGFRPGGKSRLFLNLKI